MNVFVIPSWYPSAANPHAGLFVREQVEALAALRPDWRLVVGGWGHHDGALSLRSLRSSLRALGWRWRAGEGGWRRHGAIDEAVSPALTWTLGLLGGGAAGLLRATRRNLERMTQRFGAVQLMHAHVAYPAGWIAARLSAQTGIPYVLTEHMGPFPFPALRTRDGGLRAELREAFEHAAASVAVSPALAERIRAEGLPCTHVIPNLVDERRFLPGDPAPRPFVLLSIAAQTHHKGIDTLLRAFARWNPPAGDVELRIGGAGPQAAAHRQLARALGVDDRVRWLGALAPQDVPQHVVACHAFVLASRHETFGVVLAEALACGKPVLATRCGGPESIVHDGNGRLVAVDDVPALAEALAWMRARAAEFDAAAIRADALRRFSRAAVAGRLAALYESVIARR
ncbi:glycosyltransferase [uncultured Piscinibacter sp.]|mgnify:CR=1 FL=1|uniref:glycosyltransferase n=1 Tax=uncultured Piscinibacter sp. TaxID=1131835 RepID=UPI00262BCF47|nr:glycosyltransferase [uncultured Piscinibacter sp.]